MSTGGPPGGTPDSVSEQLKLTVTFVLFQPFGFASGKREARMTGGVLSNVTVTVFAGSTFPATSVAKNVTVVSPSLDMKTLVDRPSASRCARTTASAS